VAISRHIFDLATQPLLSIVPPTYLSVIPQPFLPRVDAGKLLEKTWYNLGRGVVNLYASLFFRRSVVYKAPVPAGAKILAANHPSTTDPFLMNTLVPEQVSILIIEHFFKLGVIGASLRHTGQIRVDCANGKPSLEEGVEALREGRTVGIFPEGIISPLSGGTHRAHTGVARLALSTLAPVIPVGIAVDTRRLRQIVTKVDGKDEVGCWYLRGPYAITVGEPVFFHGFVDNHDHVRMVTEQIMQRITALSAESAERLAAAKGQQLAAEGLLPGVDL
jgi:1-acyl-sn-glycerol-3-phosphate acyltransferase